MCVCVCVCDGISLGSFRNWKPVCVGICLSYWEKRKSMLSSCGWWSGTSFSLFCASGDLNCIPRDIFTSFFPVTWSPANVCVCVCVFTEELDGEKRWNGEIEVE